MICAICGKEFLSHAACQKKHFVCDHCHREKAVEQIRSICFSSTEKNPIALAQEMMKNDWIPMHGPEHHFLLPAVLATCYVNCGGNLQLEKVLQEVEQRSAQIPGGVCGFWGACGAGIGAGIFASILEEVTPLAKDSWQFANLVTARCLKEIALHGGPRCCKRDSFLAICTAVPLLEKKTGIKMILPAKIHCTFSCFNKECKKKECLYFLP